MQDRTRENAHRIAGTLERYSEDTQTVDRIAELLNYLPEQLREDIRSLSAYIDRAEDTGNRKERLLALMSEYEQELAEAEYTAEVKDPDRMDIIDALWKAQNSITGYEAIKRYRKETEGENPAYMRDPPPKG